MNKQDKIIAFKELLDDLTRAIYTAGKIEGLQGDKEDRSDKICNMPIDLLSEAIKEINTEPEETMGFIIPQIKIEKVFTSEETERRLMNKFGKKKMEILAKQMKFKGKLLNIKKTKTK